MNLQSPHVTRDQSLLSSFHKKDMTMTNIPVSASDDTVKPATPVTPQQQTQGNPPKPADKPSEQQK
jgi:hypothetical protein